MGSKGAVIDNAELIQRETKRRMYLSLNFVFFGILVLGLGLAGAIWGCSADDTDCVNILWVLAIGFFLLWVILHISFDYGLAPVPIYSRTEQKVEKLAAKLEKLSKIVDELKGEVDIG